MGGELPAEIEHLGVTLTRGRQLPQFDGGLGMGTERQPAFRGADMMQIGKTQTGHGSQLSFVDVLGKSEVATSRPGRAGLPPVSEWRLLAG